ncbi:MAG: peptidoglycan-binding protein [Chitinophagaceae bacterium]|nr:peptidoglycan-binding protein [Chitinophagaceae bacterium]
MKQWLKIKLLMVLIFFTQCSVSDAENHTMAENKPGNYATSYTQLQLDSAVLEHYIISKNVDTTTAKRMRTFYSNRDFQYAWFDEDGITEHLLSFWNLHANFVDYTKDSSLFDLQLHEQMDLLMQEDEFMQLNNETTEELEINLTHHFFDYAKYAYAGKTNPEQLQWNIPRKKVDVVLLLDSLINQKGKNLTEWEPVHPQYSAFKEKLFQLYEIEKTASWSAILLDNKNVLKKGDYVEVITAVKERLYALGDLKQADTTSLFDSPLHRAVQRFQMRHGLKQDGVIGPATLAVLNTPLENRIQQV